MRVVRIMIATVLAAALSACSVPAADTVWDSLYDFATIQTYDWVPKEAEEGPDLPYDLLDRAIHRAVDANLSSKGYRLSSDNPTFRVIYYVGLEEVTRLTNNAYYGAGWGGYWGYGWYGPGGVNESQYDEGSITIDMISPDPAVGLVWRGVAKGTVSAISTQSMEAAVEKAVNDILDGFPPQNDR